MGGLHRRWQRPRLARSLDVLLDESSRAFTHSLPDLTADRGVDRARTLHLERLLAAHGGAAPELGDAGLVVLGPAGRALDLALGVAEVVVTVGAAPLR